MALTQTPTSELEAINEMFAAINEAPVNSLTATGVPNLADARQKLHNVNRELQMRGWWFNREYDVVMARDVNDEIPVGLDVLAIDSTIEYKAYDVVQRGTRLWDRAQNQYTFDQNIECDIIRFLSFSDLPEPFRRYVTIVAARRFADDVVGDDDQHLFRENDEAYAKALCEQTDLRAEDSNSFLDSSHAIQMHRYRRGVL